MEYPCKRNWVELGNDVATSSTIQPIRIMTYNILAQNCIRRELFQYCSSECLKWKNRREILLREMKESKSDIICLQECDSNFYSTYWRPNLEKLGYKSKYKAKTVPNLQNTFGCGIFFKEERFSAVHYEDIEFQKLGIREDGTIDDELYRPNVAQIVVLQLKNETEGIIVGNTHLFWNPRFEYLRLRQSSLLLETIHRVQTEFGHSFVLCGDFNTSPNDLPYQFLTQRIIPDEMLTRFLPPDDFSNSLKDVVQDSVNGVLQQQRENRQVETEGEQLRMEDVKELLRRARQLPLLESAYQYYTELVPSSNGISQGRWQGEPPFTMYGNPWNGTLDYVFFPRQNDEETRRWRPVRILEIPSVEVVTKQVGLPNDMFGSDHVSLMCEFVLV